MLVFVDESGDPGHKLDQGSSALFLVALVVFADHDEAQACDDAIRDLRREREMPESFEFHFADNSLAVKKLFLDTVVQFRFDTHIFALDKARATGPGLQYKGPLYKWTARTAFSNARPFLSDARIIIDESGDRQFQHELCTYLKREMNDQSQTRAKAIRSVKTQRSSVNNLLQLADYVASASARNITSKNPKDHNRLFRESHLASHEQSFRVWP